MTKDFSHQDLRGKSFKGQDLTGADFSHADIRGVNFKGAILKGANFSNAKGGLTKKSFAVYLLIISILSILAGILLAFSGKGIVSFFEMAESLFNSLFNKESSNNHLYFLYTFTIVYALISVYIIHKGNYKFWNISLISIAFIVIGVALGIGLALAVHGTKYAKGASIGLLAIASSVAGLAVAAIIVAVACTGVIAFSGVIAAASSSVVTIGIAVALAVAITTASMFVGYKGADLEVFSEAESGGGAIIIYLILSIYIAYRTSKEDLQFGTFRKFGIFISSAFGTNFCGANLTDAYFGKASLKYSRLSKETIILRTCFQNAENLKFARLTGTILENKEVRELLVSSNGKNQSFRGINLKGAYLVGTDLSGADFHETDLIAATLENANLRDANLSRIQALGVEFRGADFTGACLEAWNIDSTTQLDGAKADYVYLLNNKLERRPASGNFGEGEFAKLFNEVLDTVDFIFRNGIDWQAFMISFDKLREKIRVESEDAEISIQSIANKGDGVFVIKVNVPLDADKAEIHSTLTKEYDMNLRLIEAKYQAQLAGKEELITAYHHEIVHYRQQSTDMLRIIQEQPQIHITAIEKVSMIHAGDIKDSIVISGDENKVSG